MVVEKYTCCPYCRGVKHGPITRERYSPCRWCEDTMGGIREILPTPQNSVLTIAAGYALNDNRYYLILENNGIFRLYKKKCCEGIGGREIEPKVGTLNDLWDNFLYVTIDPYHGVDYGINPHLEEPEEDYIIRGCGGYGWPVNHWPSQREVFLVINAHEIFISKYPSLDIYPTV